MNDQNLMGKLLTIQKTLEAVSKSSHNPHFRSNFSGLNEVLSVAKEACNKLGLLILQRVGHDEVGKYVVTEITDGEQTVASRVPFSGSEDNMQKIGAAVTYARRIGLKALLAMEDIDDDGEMAVGRGAQDNYKGQSVPGKGAQASAKPPVAPIQPRPSDGAPQSQDRKTLNDLIRQTGKVLADMKKQPLEVTASLVKSYGVKATEELTDDQAKEVCAKLKAIVNA